MIYILALSATIFCVSLTTIDVFRGVKQSHATKRAARIAELALCVTALLCGAVALIAYIIEPFGTQNLDEILEALK